MKKKKEPIVIDKRVLEYVLTEQQEELEGREHETLCRRREEALVDLKSGTSADTAARDIKDMVEKSVLVAGDGQRNVAYGIVISDENTMWPGEEEIGG